MPTSAQPSCEYLPEVPHYSNCDLNVATFLHNWAKGLPAVVSHIQLQGKWDPQYFVDNYGKEKVTLINCETQATRPATVAEFFNDFIKPGERAGIWKLKACALL
jgi:hypothetical protein